MYNNWIAFFFLFAECQSVVPHCAKCLDSSRCRKCRSNFHAFFNKSGMVCVRHCPKNLFAFNSSYFGKYCKKPLVGKYEKDFKAISRQQVFACFMTDISCANDYYKTTSVRNTFAGNNAKMPQVCTLKRLLREAIIWDFKTASICFFHDRYFLHEWLL